MHYQTVWDHEFLSLRSDNDREVSATFFLGAAQQTIACMIIAGGKRHLTLPIDEIIDHATCLRAQQLLLVHTHPSGNPHPSDQDMLVTRKICARLRHHGMRLYDHMIIGKHIMYSFRAHGLL
jgi:DNA repair protein RadC